jgi:hypothetical protein
MTPEATAELALTHDEQLRTAFVHVMGHLSDAATQELLAPIAADGPWRERSYHWLQGALGEVPHVNLPSPHETVADWVRSQAQFRRAPEVGEALQAPAARRTPYVKALAEALPEVMRVVIPGATGGC